MPTGTGHHGNPGPSAGNPRPAGPAGQNAPSVPDTALGTPGATAGRRRGQLRAYGGDPRLRAGGFAEQVRTRERWKPCQWKAGGSPAMRANPSIHEFHHGTFTHFPAPPMPHCISPGSEWHGALVGEPGPGPPVPPPAPGPLGGPTPCTLRPHQPSGEPTPGILSVRCLPQGP